MWVVDIFVLFIALVAIEIWFEWAMNFVAKRPKLVHYENNDDDYLEERSFKSLLVRWIIAILGTGIILFCFFVMLKSFIAEVNIFYGF